MLTNPFEFFLYSPRLIVDKKEVGVIAQLLDTHFGQVEVSVNELMGVWVEEGGRHVQYVP